MKTYELEQWFERKICLENPVMKQGYDLKLKNETEKAYLFLVETDFGNLEIWVPKSATIGIEIRDDGKRYLDEMTLTRYKNKKIK